MKKRNLWTRMLCFLRRNGMLCRKTQPNPYSRKRVSHVVLPYEGYTPNFNKTAQHIHKQVRQ